MSRVHVFPALLLLATGILSCESKEDREMRVDLQSIQRHTDSLVATGEHGYYVATYLVGRFKTSRIKKPPFEMLIGRMDERLLESPIALHLVDSVSYELTYTLDGEQKTAECQIDAGMLGTDFTLRLSLDSTARRSLRELSAMSWELRVYAY